VSEIFELACELVGIPSVSREEGRLADRVEELLASSPHLTVRRIGDNVVARTDLGRDRRVIVAGHLDTVSSGAQGARIEDGTLWGLGAADMKGTLAVMITLAGQLDSPTFDATWIFYAREEIARSESGLLEIELADPTLLEGDVAILGEPTDAAVEAGCQGTLRLEVLLGGIPAHTARPFMGLNAAHRLAPLLSAIVAASPRTVTIDGVTFAEQCEVVGVHGGSGGNVVPAEVTLVVNHRFAPDRTPEAAIAWLRGVIDPHLDAARDHVEVIDVAPGALPSLEDPVLGRLVALSARPVSAKVGWTDVATFAGRGIPAANFGAGDPLLAHHPEERVSEESLLAVASTLRDLLTEPSPA